jgi:diguanylate cyclase (GGDEF)-like protein
MYESALRDGLTKVFNKKYFIDRLESEFSFATRHRTDLSLIMFDIDHFKVINDQHGHLAGDYVLSALAAEVSAKIRDEDVFARYGGEEFSIISRGIPLGAAHSFAERLRRSVEDYRFQYETKRLTVTVSLGVAAVPDGSIRRDGRCAAAR